MLRVKELMKRLFHGQFRVQDLQQSLPHAVSNEQHYQSEAAFSWLGATKVTLDLYSYSDSLTVKEKGGKTSSPKECGGGCPTFAGEEG